MKIEKSQIKATQGPICETGSAPPRLKANCDQECCVKARIETAMRMALAVRRERGVCADGPLYECALDGIANGAAVEIIRTLGLEPEFKNLQGPRNVSEKCLYAGGPASLIDKEI